MKPQTCPILRSTALACLVLFAGSAALAQVRDLGPNLASVPADLIAPDPDEEATTPNVSPYTQPDPQPDLGQDSADMADRADTSDTQTYQDIPAPASSRVDAAMAKAKASSASKGSKSIRKPAATHAATRYGTERALFERAPVRVPLPLDAERLITLPAPAALHVPADMDKVARLEIIDRTIYATALVPFTPLRIIAELIDSGQQIPLDLVSDRSTASARSELEVFVVEPASAAHGPASLAASEAASQAVSQAANAAAQDTLSQQMAEAPPTDMVQLTRYAARQLYAPKRLATPVSGVQQVEVTREALPDLFRGAHVLSTPVGQWRSGQLYVTAVLVQNRSRWPLEIPLEQVRGQWIAATAQHGRIGAAGSETDTTAVYLVCDRRFEACR